MILTNPWGLLTLLAIPAILGLHFFRSQRRVRMVGGLHLWRFAKTRLPIGGRFQRLTKSLSLLFQLLAALILALLAAGLDFPREASLRHYSVILDDTLSMQAGSVGRAREMLTAWAPTKARFTLIGAGLRPRMIAGPYATRDEMTVALAGWVPEAPACSLDEAVSLASKFSAATEKLLIVTDRPGAAGIYADSAVIAGVGLAQPNAGIEFADRQRVTLEKDRVTVRVRLWDGAAGEVQMRAFIGEQTIFDQVLACEPGRAQSVAFDTGSLDSTIRLELDADALTPDNEAWLAPVAIKTVVVGLDGLEGRDEYFRRAAEAVPYTSVVNRPHGANLVFTTRSGALPSPAPAHVCALPDPFLTVEAGLTQGRLIWLDRRDPIVENLTLEGALWAYDADSEPLPGEIALAASGDFPLLAAVDSAGGRRRYRMNLLIDRTNLFTHTAWPAMMQRMVEACREALPGPVRSNFRLGETVRLNLVAGPIEGGYKLMCDGAEADAFETPPEALAEPAAGQWTLEGGGKTLAHFCVNRFVPEESDLRSCAALALDAGALDSGAVRHAEMNRPLYYGLLLLLIVLVALSWVCQDISR